MPYVLPSRPGGMSSGHRVLMSIAPCWTSRSATSHIGRASPHAGSRLDDSRYKPNTATKIAMYQARILLALHRIDELRHLRDLLLSGAAAVRIGRRTRALDAGGHE